MLGTERDWSLPWDVGQCSHCRGEGRGPPPGSQATSGRPSLATILPLLRGLGGQSPPAPGACEDFLISALLTRQAAQSRLPPVVDGCQANPALSPCPGPLPSGSLLHPLLFSLPLFSGVPQQCRDPHCTVTSLGFKAPRGRALETALLSFMHKETEARTGGGESVGSQGSAAELNPGLLTPGPVLFLGSPP